MKFGFLHRGETGNGESGDGGGSIVPKANQLELELSVVLIVEYAVNRVGETLTVRNIVLMKTEEIEER